MSVPPTHYFMRIKLYSLFDRTKTMAATVSPLERSPRFHVGQWLVSESVTFLHVMQPSAQNGVLQYLLVLNQPHPQKRLKWLKLIRVCKIKGVYLSGPVRAAWGAAWKSGPQSLACVPSNNCSRSMWPHPSTCSLKTRR